MQIVKKMRLTMMGTLLMGAAVVWTSVTAQELPQGVSDALKQAKVSSKSVGVYVQEAGASQAPLLSLNADQSFNPASVMKLVTTNAALELLGPAYAWNTYGFVDGALNNGVLEGNLMIQGSGDPKFVVEDFWLFLRSLRAKGIREIRGNVVVDGRLFTLQESKVNFDEEPQKPYNATPSALLLNFKSIAFRFIADSTSGKVNVSTEPSIDYPIVAPKLGAGDCGDWKTKLRADFKSKEALFKGEFPAACVDQVWYVHPDTMTSLQYFDRVFRQMWTELGGIVSGKTVSGEVSVTARQVAQWKSPFLIDVIRDINKFSNNVMARQLLLTLIAERVGGPAEPAQGEAIIRQWLNSKGIDAKQLVVENGSGLSRNERVTPELMGKMLLSTFHSPLMPEFVSSLPIVGVDGTMKSRLVDQKVSGQAHIKTGYLNEARSVAGYVRAASGKYYVVVSFINHRNAKDTQAALDQLLQWVYDNG